jgi:hypothetical protein
MPAETPLLPKKRINVELLLSLSATFLSLAALTVSIFQTKIAREQQHASVWPYLQLGASSNGTEYNYGIMNRGIGPAIVKEVEWIYRDSVYKHTHEFIYNEIGFAKGLGRSKMEPNEVFSPTSGVSLITVYGNDSLVNIVSKILESDLFRLRVTYSDVYGNCWRLDKDKTEKLADCPK